MISAQDLEDEKQNCSYLKEQMVKVLKRLQKPKDHGTKQSKVGMNSAKDLISNLYIPNSSVMNLKAALIDF